jgi:hypothetical protein
MIFGKRKNCNRDVSKAEWARLLLELTQSLGWVREGWINEGCLKVFPEYPNKVKLDIIVKNFQLCLVVGLFGRREYIPIPEGREFMDNLFAQVGATYFISEYMEICNNSGNHWFENLLSKFIEDVVNQYGNKRDVDRAALADITLRLAEGTELAVAICFKDEEQSKANEARLNKLVGNK